MSEIFANPLTELAEYADMKRDLEQGRGPIQICGVTDSQKVHLMYEMSADVAWKLVVTYDDTRAREIYDDFSYSWFRKVFKDYTGYAPAKYFLELKLRKAKQLLVGTSRSVKEISFLLGYKSTEHFFSLFKKHTDFTPLEYRSFGRDTDTEEETEEQ